MRLTPEQPGQPSKRPSTKKVSDQESSEAIIRNAVPKGPNVVVLQVTVSKSMITRTRSESQGKRIVPQRGRGGGRAFCCSL